MPQTSRNGSVTAASCNQRLLDDLIFKTTRPNKFTTIKQLFCCLNPMQNLFVFQKRTDTLCAPHPVAPISPNLHTFHFEVDSLFALAVSCLGDSLFVDSLLVDSCLVDSLFSDLKLICNSKINSIRNRRP